MKRFLILILLFCAGMMAAESLPDNMYFRAMNDEMQRSKKKLHIAGQPGPLYIAYRIKEEPFQRFAADLGVLKPCHKPQWNNEKPSVSVYIYSGDKQNNSSGYEPKQAKVYIAEKVAKGSYDSVREKLWQLSDEEYVASSKMAEEKAAIKRDKQMQEMEAEFSQAPKAHFVEPIKPFVPRDPEVYSNLVKELSAEGKEYPYIEMYTVAIVFGDVDTYFLDSEGNFYQLQQPDNLLNLRVQLRNKDGYKLNYRAVYSLPADETKLADFARQKSAEFLHHAALRYKAQKADFYAGPVLLMPKAAANFLGTLLGGNIIRTKAVLTPSGYDKKNQLVHKLGHRIMSPILEVFDRPLQRQFKGFALSGFMPVDAEGVAAKELHIVEGGKLKEIPTVRSLLKGQKYSNGHARRINDNYPAAWVSNLFFEPKHPLSQTQLEEKLLELCREQELEYCYIWHENDGVYGLAEKIYTKDGHREPVYGFAPQIFSKEMRPLRDIVAAADQLEINEYEGNRSIINPAILVRDMEFLPIEEQPERKPFVPMP